MQWHGPLITDLSAHFAGSDFRGENLIKNIEIPGIPVVFRWDSRKKLGERSAAWNLNKSRSRKSVVHTTSRDLLIHSLERPPRGTGYCLVTRHHQDYEPFFVGNPNLNLHLWRLHPRCGGVKPKSIHHDFTTLVPLLSLKKSLICPRCLSDSFAPPLFFSWDDCWEQLPPTGTDPILQVFGLFWGVKKSKNPQGTIFNNEKTNGKIGGVRSV